MLYLLAIVIPPRPRLRPSPAKGNAGQVITVTKPASLPKGDGAVCLGRTTDHFTTVRHQRFGGGGGFCDGSSGGGFSGSTWGLLP